MAFKRLSQGSVVYWVNVEKIAYLQEHEKTTYITFAAADSERMKGIAVDQSASQILAGEETRT